MSVLQFKILFGIRPPSKTYGNFSNKREVLLYQEDDW